MPVEIERKYVIEMPDISLLRRQQDFTESEIEQIYLSVEGATHRIRARRRADSITYTETKKYRIDDISAVEDEKEISEVTYRTLAEHRAAGTAVINKTRYTFVFCDQLFEIDVYPQWRKHAILETELDKKDEIVPFPDFIKVKMEVTGNKAYSNAGMSRAFPDEPICDTSSPRLW